MIFWLWAALLVLLVLGFVGLLFGMIPVPRAGAGGRRPWPMMLAGGALVLALGVLIGWLVRPGAAPVPADASPPADDGAQLIAQLEARLQATPNEPKGWALLGFSRFQTGDYAKAAQAYARAAALEPRNPEHMSALGEAQVMAAGGTVPATARAAFGTALDLAPGDQRARYYLAVAKDQDGNVEGAIEDWLALLKDIPPDAPIAAELTRIVAGKAAAAKIDIAGRLPTVQAGPSAAQVADAAAMPPADQQAMIRGMVDRLDAKLADNPDDLAGWQRLVRSRMVLGERDKAAQALARGRAALAGNATALAALDASAKASGL